MRKLVAADITLGLDYEHYSLVITHYRTRLNLKPHYTRKLFNTKTYYNPIISNDDKLSSIDVYKFIFASLFLKQ